MIIEIILDEINLIHWMPDIVNFISQSTAIFKNSLARLFCNKSILLLILFTILFNIPLSAQVPSYSNYPDSLVPKRLRTIILAESIFYVGGILYLNNIWYKDHQSVPFHFYNDNAGWKQLDKAGHMYSAYYESYYGMKALQWAGVPKKKAIWWGGMLGFILQAPIEVFDGLYEGYGFSVGDIVANTAGATLMIGQELLWNEQRIMMKFSYSPTQYPKYRPSYFGEAHVEKFFTDYNGHTYWLSANLSSFAPESSLPKWLNLAVGFGADGMLAEFTNPTSHRGTPLPDFERSRQLYLSIDVDLRKIPTRSKFLKGVLHTLNMLKLPAPTLEFNTSEGIKFHPLYF